MFKRCTAKRAGVASCAVALLRKPSMLIVDDDVELTTLLARLARRQGYGVRVVASALAAEIELAEDTPLLVMVAPGPIHTSGSMWTLPLTCAP